jgi:hypothetical protein
VFPDRPFAAHLGNRQLLAALDQVREGLQGLGELLEIRGVENA